MNTSNPLGKQAERIAEKFLVRKSWKILGRNFRHGPHEIDIIACRDDLIVFVEVKARTSSMFGFPESMITHSQILSIQLAAEEFLHRTQWDSRVRFDVISIEKYCNGLRLWHIEDAF